MHLQNMVMHPLPRRVMEERKMKHDNFGNAPDTIWAASQALLFCDGIEIVIERRFRATKRVLLVVVVHWSLGSWMASSCGVRRSSLNARRRGASVNMEKRKSSRQTDFG